MLVEHLLQFLHFGNLRIVAFQPVESLGLRLLHIQLDALPAQPDGLDPVLDVLLVVGLLADLLDALVVGDHLRLGEQFEVEVGVRG